MPARSGLVISPVVATFEKCLQSPVAFQTGLDCTTHWLGGHKNIFRGTFTIYIFRNKKIQQLSC